MSRIYFHNPDLDRDLELLGSERAYMGRLISDLSLALLPPELYERQIKRHLHPDNYLLKYSDEHFAQLFKTWLRVGDDKLAGVKDSMFSLQLNTAYKFGNDQIKLLSRMHGQCEIHAWIRADHLPWLAEIIDTGLALGIYRRDSGWETVKNFAKSYVGRFQTVLSYSVCDQFPNARMAGFDGDDDSYYDLPDTEQWGRAAANLDPKLEITPDGWGEYYFGHGSTVFDLLSGDS